MRNMISKERKRTAASYKKLQMLRSITNSHARSKTSIIVDATKYIEELKQRVERMNQDIAMAQNPTCHNTLIPVKVRVEAQDKGYLIKVFSERSCRGLLVFILEAFEKLGLEVLQARVSCSECFLLEAIGVIKDDDEGSESVDSQEIKRAVSQAIQNWSTAQVINE
ncbi:hypothetical protein CCACVL1_11645 [Corchorus capsularis]|uniref:Plant bHLH transcription factor ACT-like domain-containing protein n=1 Tax=Corchorus capsularis TaxID=210143 RepID=A0A1R3IK55_COCAP|nr:hypothetical protein CCACVL1_11645 [Corchorus capsularis]